MDDFPTRPNGAVLAAVMVVAVLGVLAAVVTHDGRLLLRSLRTTA
jgi:hypothetical protein